MKNQSIYIIITQTGTLISRTIKLFTKAPYNHVSVSDKKDLTSMFSFCRNRKNYPLPATFNQEHTDTVVFGMYKNIPCEIYEIPVTEAQYKEYQGLLKHFRRNRSVYHFNVLGLFAIGLGINLRRSRGFTCSQFVAYMLQNSGICSFKKGIFLAQPDDFRFIPGAKLIYKGNLKEYEPACVPGVTAAE